MAKKESTQHKLDRVRAPRVQLTYDVEVGDAIEKKELPFVAGVVGNFSGQPITSVPWTISTDGVVTHLRTRGLLRDTSKLSARASGATQERRSLMKPARSPGFACS